MSKRREEHFARFSRIVVQRMVAYRVVGAEWGKPSLERVTHRNGYRHRDLGTRAGTIDVAIAAERRLAASADGSSLCSSPPQAVARLQPHRSCALFVSRGVEA